MKQKDGNGFIVGLSSFNNKVKCELLPIGNDWYIKLTLLQNRFVLTSSMLNDIEYFTDVYDFNIAIDFKESCLVISG